MNALLAYGGNIVQGDMQNKVQLLIPTGWPKVYQNQAGNTKDRERTTHKDVTPLKFFVLLPPVSIYGGSLHKNSLTQQVGWLARFR